MTNIFKKILYYIEDRRDRAMRKRIFAEYAPAFKELEAKENEATTAINKIRKEAGLPLL